MNGKKSPSFSSVANGKKSPPFSSVANADPAPKSQLQLDILSISIHSSVQLTHDREIETSDCELLRDVASLTESYVSAEPSAVVTEEKENAGGRKRRNRWRDVCAMVCLWISYLLCSAAYSIIAPFFPEEVGSN